MRMPYIFYMQNKKEFHTKEYIYIKNNVQLTSPPPFFFLYTLNYMVLLFFLNKTVYAGINENLRWVKGLQHNLIEAGRGSRPFLELGDLWKNIFNIIH